MTEYAFPHRTNQGYEQAGMTLRDYFAAQTLAGLVTHPGGDAWPEDYARAAYMAADAMLKARGGD